MKYLRIIVVMLFVIFLSSCRREFEEFRDFEYIISDYNDGKKIQFVVEITNTNDYNVKNINFVFDAYYEDTYLGEFIVETEIAVKHRRTIFLSDFYIIDNYENIDRIELRTYTYELANFYDSYSDDIIGAAIMTCIMLIPLLIYFIIEDYMYSDFNNLLQHYYYIIPIPFVLVLIGHLLANILAINRLEHVFEWMFIFFSYEMFLSIIPICYLFLFIQDKISNIGKMKIKK